METLRAYIIYHKFILYIIISSFPAIYIACNKEFLGTFPLKMSGLHSFLSVNEHFHDHTKNKHRISAS
jgi:hypothetical protein